MENIFLWEDAPFQFSRTIRGKRNDALNPVGGDVVVIRLLDEWCSRRWGNEMMMVWSEFQFKTCLGAGGCDDV